MAGTDISSRAWWSVESYIGEKGGREGVKLEDEILITETGSELLSRFPYEEDFLGGVE
jgi:Xaa-Pro aminopeptidase